MSALSGIFVDLAKQCSIKINLKLDKYKADDEGEVHWQIKLPQVFWVDRK